MMLYYIPGIVLYTYPFTQLEAMLQELSNVTITGLHVLLALVLGKKLYSIIVKGMLAASFTLSPYRTESVLV